MSLKELVAPLEYEKKLQDAKTKAEEEPPQKEPYKHKYAAIDSLRGLMDELEELHETLSEEHESERLYLRDAIALIMIMVGALHCETDEPMRGMPLLALAVRHYSGRVKFMNNLDLTILGDGRRIISCLCPSDDTEGETGGISISLVPEEKVSYFTNDYDALLMLPLLILALNQMAVDRGGRGEYKMALSLISRAETAYSMFTNRYSHQKPEEINAILIDASTDVIGLPVLGKLIFKELEEGQECPFNTLLPMLSRSMVSHTFTHTLYYAAQVNANCGNKDVASEYCFKTLLRQMNGGSDSQTLVYNQDMVQNVYFAPLDWVTNATSLIEFYTNMIVEAFSSGLVKGEKGLSILNGNVSYKRAVFLFECANKILIYHKDCLKNNKDPDAPSVPYSLKLMFAKLLSTIISGIESNITMDSGKTYNLRNESVQSMITLLVDDNYAVNFILKYIDFMEEDKEDNSEDEEIDAKITKTDKTLYVCLVNSIIKDYQFALSYFKLDGFVSTNADILLNMSAMYRSIINTINIVENITPFQPAILLSRRIRLLAPLSVLNTNYYLSIIRDASFDVGESYESLFDITLEDINKLLGYDERATIVFETEFPKPEVTRALCHKAQIRAQNALKAFNAYLESFTQEQIAVQRNKSNEIRTANDTLKLEVGQDLMDLLDEVDLSSYIQCLMDVGRIHFRIPFDDPHDTIQHIELAIKIFNRIKAFVQKRVKEKDADPVFASYGELVGQLLSLLPSKIRAVQQGIARKEALDKAKQQEVEHLKSVSRDLERQKEAMKALLEERTKGTNE